MVGYVQRPWEIHIDMTAPYIHPTLSNSIAVRAILTILVNSSHSRSSQRKSKVNIYAMRGIVYNTCLARGNPKRML
jgi:hypothetical protein